MTRITPAMPKSVIMVTQSEQRQDNLDTPEIQRELNLRTSLNDVTFKIARPLVMSMSLFGLLHLSGKERRWSQITKIYSILVVLGMWAVFVRFFTLYGLEGFGPVLIFKVILHSWIILCAVSATSTYMACKRQNKLVIFLSRWSRLLKLKHGSGQAFEKDFFNRYVRKAKLSFYSCLIVSWIAFIIACGSIGYTLFTTPYFDFMILPMEPVHPQALLLKCFWFVIFVYMCAAWVFTLCLFYNIGSVIYEEFRIFHLDFQKAVQPNGDIESVENYRRRHQEICLSVENADDILSGFSAVGILMSMVFGMLVLYNMILHQGEYENSVVLAANIFWLLSSLVYLGVISVGGGYLNHMAHSPLKTIHNIQPKTLTADISFQMTMFLNKLTGESIGLTAMGMFVIDKPTILTIAGAFLTYFIVLVQFRKPSDQPTVFANCTRSIAP